MAKKKTVARADESPVVQSPAEVAPVAAAPVAEAVQPEQPTPTEAPAVPEATSFTVYDPKGNPHRTYSRDVHGPEFEKLAHQYVSSRPGWSVR